MKSERESECPICPEFTVRCVHFEDSIIQIEFYDVEPRTCAFHVLTDGRLLDRSRGCFRLDQEQLADAEFDRREAQLRSRKAPA
ncbi:hypothetical protein LCGC14_1167820 [marine sediment metagenome]|uniref:Uncharacterized protein n=1 Tax=marine sediment metagenome TaxID=412755 RepID=A0A0F9LVL6_9ZZZZ